MTTDWHIAQMNVATALHPINDPRMAEFVNQLDTINALAERSPGFVWRLQTDEGNALDIEVENYPSLLVNMSVWESAEALFEFAYRSAHRLVLAKRRQWFRRPEGDYQVLWWVAAGHRPSVAEGIERLELLKRTGPGPEAFGFKTKYPPPGRAGSPEDLKPEPFCAGWE